MSAYKTIQTEFRHLPSLLKALADLGYPTHQVEVAPNPKQPSLTLYGYTGMPRLEKASVRIPKANFGTYEDVGFVWNGTGYTAIISTHDTRMNLGEGKLATLKQRYALHEVRRQARARGYSVQEKVDASGVIRITLVRR